MDTKSKNNKIPGVTGILISLLLLWVLAVGVIAFYPVYLKGADHLMEKVKGQDEISKIEVIESYKEEFINRLYQGNYSLYWDIMEQNSKADMAPRDIYLGGLTDRNDKVTEDINENEYENDSQNNYGYDVYDDRQNFINNFDEVINSWHNAFFTGTIGNFSLEYYIIDHKTGNTLTNTVTPLNAVTENTEEAQKVKAGYSFYGVFEYDMKGNVNIPVFYGLEESKKAEYGTLELTKDLLRSELNNSTWVQYYNLIKAPSEVTIIYAAKPADFYIPLGQDPDTNYQWREYWAFKNGGFQYAFLISLVAVTALALILPFKKTWALGKGIEGKLPLELGLFGFAAVLNCTGELSSMAMETISGNFLGFTEYSIIPDWLERVLDYGVNYLVWMFIFLIWFIFVLSLHSVFTLGVKDYLKERTLTGRLLRWVFDNLKKLFASLADIDLTDASNKAIIKILAVNFVILMLLCSIWLAGVAVLIPYTIILFFVMKKYLADIKSKYAILLNATSSMAEGNLEVAVEEDLGIFNPLKEELTKIRFGFKRAVEEETKSQKMKTELITNVSHDLKTPLTAIITYINLLKEDNITEEERNSYIETLDNKSLRLKKLIEDLFEISKATSNNVTLNLVDVDLASLIKQVQLELSDKINEANIEFRNQFQTEKVILKLDSEKTYRIFENLIINIAKYALPGTRAYVEVQGDDKEVTVSLKNISAAELNLNTEEITERFVRGDESRNTEGSGLGLAIVKNFVELQGGKFYIQLDGDLFKAIIQWKK